MQCKVCQEPAIGACINCGGLYCARHGGVWSRWPICVKCFDDGRRHLVTGAAVMAGAGALLLSLAVLARNWGFAAPAVGFFGAAAWLFLESRRPNPWSGQARDR